MSLSTFAGFEVARSALNASQTALNTVNHNVSNSDTDGYSRQRADLAVNTPYTVPSLRGVVSAGQIGTGVTVEQVIRYRDKFADQQYRNENKYYGQAVAKKNYLDQIESIYNEPGDTAIQSCLDDFWKGMQDLSNEAGSSAIRAALKETTLQLTDSLNHTYSEMTELREEADSEIVSLVTEINTILTQLKDLNKAIVKVESTGDNANDYRDSRDLLLDELSGKVNIQYEELSDGSVSVYIGGKLVASADSCSQIIVTKVNDPIFAGRKINDLIWSDTGSPVEAASGKLKGILEVRDEIIPDALNYLDDIAYTLATKINYLHKDGRGLNGETGYNFFVSTKDPDTSLQGVDATHPPKEVEKAHLAKYITLNSVIQNDVSYIGAAAHDCQVVGGSLKDVSNNAVIAKMADVSQTKYDINGVNTTINDYYQTAIAEIGTITKKVNNVIDNKEILINGIENRRDSTSGVTENDELVDMIKFQKIYASAARLVTAYDTMLETLLGMGA